MKFKFDVKAMASMNATVFLNACKAKGLSLKEALDCWRNSSEPFNLDPFLREEIAGFIGTEYEKMHLKPKLRLVQTPQGYRTEEVT